MGILMKNILILTFFITSFVYSKTICKDIIDAKINSIYIVKRKQFISDGRCVVESESVLINTQSNQKIDIDGVVDGLYIINLSNIDILMVSYFMGAHSNAVSFFEIRENKSLFPIKNGIIGTDYSKPSIFIDELFDNIVVFNRYIKDKNKCKYLVEDIFEYKNKKFNKIISNNILKKFCK